jgi:hypothetical protein
MNVYCFQWLKIWVPDECLRSANSVTDQQQVLAQTRPKSGLIQLCEFSNINLQFQT